MGAPTPNVIVTPFGTNAVGITLPIPVPSQLPGNPGYASFDDGFPSDTEGAGSLPPRWQDFQGILYMLSAYCQAATGGQFWQYNSTWSAANSGYAVGAIVAMANGLGFWLNTASGNTNNPDTTAAASSGWVPIAQYGSTAVSGLTNANVTLTAVQAAAPTLVLSGTLTGNVQIIFPTWLLRWTVINNCTGNYTVTCTTSAGTGVVIPQLGATEPTLVCGDGTNIQPLYLPDPPAVYKTTGTSRASTTTPTNDPTLQTFISSPGAFWFQCAINDASGAPSPGGLIGGMNFSGTIGTGSGCSLSSSYATDVNLPAPRQAIQSSPGGSTYELESAQTGNALLLLTGILIATTPGLFAFAWAQNSSNATATIVDAGSYLTMRRIRNSGT